MAENVIYLTFAVCIMFGVFGVMAIIADYWSRHE